MTGSARFRPTGRTVGGEVGPARRTWGGGDIGRARGGRSLLRHGPLRRGHAQQRHGGSGTAAAGCGRAGDPREGRRRCSASREMRWRSQLGPTRPVMARPCEWWHNGRLHGGSGAASGYGKAALAVAAQRACARQSGARGGAGGGGTRRWQRELRAGKQTAAAEAWPVAMGRPAR
jgi:hypothetical protein